MYRQKRINYRGIMITKDTAEALSKVEKHASDLGWQFFILGPHPPHPEDPRSLIPAGREVHFTLRGAKDASEQQEIDAAWGIAVPLGFTPWLRYPQATAGRTIFHYFGPWRYIYERLLAEGRGHLAWPSVCAAAQCDVGAWKGDHADERFAQAQLHRIGRNCGPVDGVVGPRTREAIESLGLTRAAFPQVLEHLRVAETSTPLSTGPQQVGHVALPGYPLQVAAFGEVQATQTPQGATLAVSGPGRVVIDIGDAK